MLIAAAQPADTDPQRRYDVLLRARFAGLDLTLLDELGAAGGHLLNTAVMTLRFEAAVAVFARVVQYIC